MTQGALAWYGFNPVKPSDSSGKCNSLIDRSIFTFPQGLIARIASGPSRHVGKMLLRPLCGPEMDHTHVASCTSEQVMLL